MPRIIAVAFLAVALAMSIASCGGNSPAWIALPSTAELPYLASVQTRKDGAYADQPFALKAVSKAHTEADSQLISAEQCKNVKVVQTKDTIFIFYDELILNGFSSMRYDPSLPRPFLCDMQKTFCQDMLGNFVTAKNAVSNVCTYS
jgi:hypothetical protein